MSADIGHCWKCHIEVARTASRTLCHGCCDALEEAETRASTLAADLAEAVGLLREEFGEIHDHKRPMPGATCWMCRRDMFVARVSPKVPG